MKICVGSWENHADLFTEKLGLMKIWVGSWENHADVAGSAFQLGSGCLKVKNKRIFFFKKKISIFT